MKDERFAADVLELLFTRGLALPHLLDTLDFLHQVQNDGIQSADSFARDCIDHFGLSNISRIPEFGLISSTAGAASEWLAIHEAGHAIVGVEMGVPLTGVRFNLSGTMGDCVLHDPDWPDHADEHFVLELIAIDVAGNIAQLIDPNCEPPNGGRLSDLYATAKGTGANGDLYPTDFVGADRKAHRFLFGDGNVTDPTTWEAKASLLAQAESLAETILRRNHVALTRLASALRNGPIAGSAVDSIIREQWLHGMHQFR